MAEETQQDQKTSKSFKDLEAEVVSRGICGKCGGCASFCSADELNALAFDRDKGPSFANEDDCQECGICYLVCPQIRALDNDLREKFGWEPPIGAFRAISSARTTDPKIAEVATDGGVVTALLRYAMERHRIQGALVSKKIGPFRRAPVLVTDPEELIDAAGSHFDEVEHLDEIGRMYSTYSPTIQELKTIGQKRLEHVAIVATPCQAHTVRKMHVLNVLPADTITLVIGLFCMENFSFDADARDKLERVLGVSLKSVKKLNIKDDVIVTTEDGRAIHVPFRAVDEVARPACMACPDFANEFADVSAGGLGSPDGYTTVVVRTSLGQELYNGALHDGAIEELKFASDEEASLHRTQIIAKASAFTRRKRERARAKLAALASM